MARNIRYVLLAFILFGCQNEIKVDTQTLQDQTKFYLLFKDKSLVRGGERDTSLIILTTYDENDKVNEYYLTYCHDEIVFLRDTLQYLDTSIKGNIVNFVEKHIRILDHLEIRSISAGLRSTGIDLRASLRDGSYRLYVRDSILAKNGGFKDYFNKAKRINGNWYVIDE